MKNTKTVQVNHCSICREVVEEGEEIYDDYDNLYCSDDCFSQGVESYD